MPTLDSYRKLVSEKKFHLAAREACVQAAEHAKRVGADPETHARYMHLVRAAVLNAQGREAWEELRAIRDDREVMDALDDDLREEIVREIADNAPTLVGPPPAA